MLLMAEGALADVVLLTPKSAYNKAKDIAKGRGESVDPSRSRRGAAGWEERAASTLLRFLIGYGEADLKFRRIEKGDRKGFQVFRAYGGVEAFVGELWIGEVAYFNVSEEELRRRVEEAKRTAPDLSGFDKAPQYLEWRATDASTVGRQIEAGTVHSWQLRWYFSLLGEEESFSGQANVTKEGIKLAVIAFWPREREDQILKESKWLESLLGQRVENWRELVDAINWNWVLEKVEELVDELKPWVGPEKMSDTEREELVRRMLGELALFVHFAEARKGLSDDEWREERAKRLARTVEALSGGRITGDHAERLAELIISYAESRGESVKNSINELAEKLAGVFKEDAKRVKGEVWGVVDFVLSDMYCLARDCARDEVVRKFVAPALELIMLDKALRGEFDREKALLIFGEMYATALAGDGHVASGMVVLTVGGELGGGAALLRLATLHLLNELLSTALLRQAKLLKLEQSRTDELKFYARIYVSEGVYNIAATGENAARFMRLLAVSAPSAGGEYLSDKFNEFMKETRVEVRVDNIRRTEGGLVTADLTLSEAGVAVKYNVYLRKDAIELQFHSTDRSRAELAALLLRHAGVSAEVKKESGRDKWYVEATTDKLAAGRKELRDALAEFIRKAVKNGWVDADKAERWLKKLEKGRVLMEGWPKYYVGLKDGALEVIYKTTNSGNIEQVVQQLRDMGLVEGVHFAVKMPEEGRYGYVSILKEGLAHAAFLSVYGKDEQQRRLAAEFVEYILDRAEKAGKDVYKKALEIVEEGMSRGSLKLEDFKKEVEVNGKTYVVKVLGGGAEFDVGRGGKKLLRIRITAEVSRVEGEHIVDHVEREYEITFGRYGSNNAVRGFAYVSEETDAERLAAVVEALTGVKQKIHRRSDGIIEIACTRAHLEGFKRFAELAKAIMEWLKETGR
jgi:hypothetical protein